MLQRLEGTDRLAELAPGLEVIEGEREQRIRRAQHLGSETDPGRIEHTLEGARALTDAAEHRTVCDAHGRQVELCHAAAVRHRERPSDETVR